jgi:hypothetical protein
LTKIKKNFLEGHKTCQKFQWFWSGAKGERIKISTNYTLFLMFLDASLKPAQRLPGEY